MNGRSSGDSDANSSLDVSDQSDEDFLAFRRQLEIVQRVVNECDTKIMDRSLCSEDVDTMDEEIKTMMLLEQKVTPEKMKANYVAFKVKSLKMIQESYRICNCLMEKKLQEVDTVFDIDNFCDLVFKDCDEFTNPLDHMNKLFTGVLTNTDYFNLNFFANSCKESAEQMAPSQLKNKRRRSQKRQLEDQIVPVEVENVASDNELVKSLGKIIVSLKRAVHNNEGKPVPFYKFAIDPFSLSNSVENLFHLATLVYDGVVKIERVLVDDNDEFSTISLAKKSSRTSNSESHDDNITSIMTINHDLWQQYIKMYEITDRMIEPDDTDN